MPSQDHTAGHFRAHMPQSSQVPQRPQGDLVDYELFVGDRTTEKPGDVTVPLPPGTLTWLQSAPRQRPKQMG